MNATALPFAASRQPPSTWDRFGVAIVTLLGLLCLAVALHVDDVDRQRAAPMVSAR